MHPTVIDVGIYIRSIVYPGAEKPYQYKWWKIMFSTVHDEITSNKIIR